MPLNTSPLPGIADAAAASAYLTPVHLVALSLAVLALLATQLAGRLPALSYQDHDDMYTIDVDTSGSGPMAWVAQTGGMAQRAALLLLLALLGYYVVVRAWTAYDASTTRWAGRGKEEAVLDLTGRTEMNKAEDMWVSCEASGCVGWGAWSAGE